MADRLDGKPVKSRVAVRQESTDFYAANFELGLLSPLFIHGLSRSRWRIDTKLLQTMAPVVLTMFR